MGKKQQIDKSNLGYLDIEFQYKLVKFFIEDAKFFENIVSIVDQNAFTDPVLRKFVGMIKDCYTKDSVVPSYDMMAIALKARAKTPTDIEECDALVKRLKYETSFEGIIEVKDIATRFFKQQNLIKVANKILEIAGKGELERYEECQRLMEEAGMAGQDDDFGYGIFELQDKALSNDYTVSIPTGIKMLDETLGGGLDKGKLGLLIAPAGFGKTSFTTAIASHAAAYKCDMNNHLGFKVLQIYFEDDDVDITRKHFSRITQHEARFMKRLDEGERISIANLLNNFPDRAMLDKNLRLKHFRTGTKSASDIEIFVKRLINSGFKPDLITIDYFECIASEKGGYASDSEWTREGVTMRKLENMAKDLDCAIWIPTQGSKDSMNSPEVVRMDQASGSAKKIHVAQVILSIARAMNDIDKNRAVISILKNRSGKSGKIFQDVIFNNGTCTISCDNTIEYDDALAWEADAKKAETKNFINQTRALSEIINQRKNDEQSREGNFVGVITNMKPNEKFSG